jgi:hypothetical protein
MLLICAVLLGPFSGAHGACPEPGGYSLLRFDETYEYLKNPNCASDFWDPVKYIALNGSGAYVSFGGELRQQ